MDRPSTIERNGVRERERCHLYNPARNGVTTKVNSPSHIHGDWTRRTPSPFPQAATNNRAMTMRERVEGCRRSHDFLESMCIHSWASPSYYEICKYSKIPHSSNRTACDPSILAWIKPYGLFDILVPQRDFIRILHWDTCNLFILWRSGFAYVYPPTTECWVSTDYNHVLPSTLLGNSRAHCQITFKTSIKLSPPPSFQFHMLTHWYCRVVPRSDLHNVSMSPTELYFSRRV